MRRSSRLAKRTTTVTVANNIATISSDTIPDHPKKLETSKAPLKKKQRVILPLVVQKLPKEGLYPV